MYNVSDAEYLQHKIRVACSKIQGPAADGVVPSVGPSIEDRQARRQYKVSDTAIVDGNWDANSRFRVYSWTLCSCVVYCLATYLQHLNTIFPMSRYTIFLAIHNSAGSSLYI